MSKVKFIYNLIIVDRFLFVFIITNIFMLVFISPKSFADNDHENSQIASDNEVIKTVSYVRNPETSGFLIHYFNEIEYIEIQDIKDRILVDFLDNKVKWEGKK